MVYIKNRPAKLMDYHINLIILIIFIPGLIIGSIIIYRWWNNIDKIFFALLIDITIMSVLIIPFIYAKRKAIIRGFEIDNNEIKIVYNPKKQIIIPYNSIKYLMIHQSGAYHLQTNLHFKLGYRMPIGLVNLSVFDDEIVKHVYQKVKGKMDNKGMSEKVEFWERSPSEFLLEVICDKIVYGHEIPLWWKKNV